MTINWWKIHLTDFSFDEMICCSIFYTGYKLWRGLKIDESQKTLLNRQIKSLINNSCYVVQQESLTSLANHIYMVHQLKPWNFSDLITDLCLNPSHVATYLAKTLARVKKHQIFPPPNFPTIQYQDYCIDNVYITLYTYNEFSMVVWWVVT